MKRYLAGLSLTISVAAALCGCGGGGSASPAAVASVYAGNWHGNWSTEGQPRGLVSLYIAANGGVNMQLGTEGHGTGTLARQGDYHVIYSWAAGDDITVTGRLLPPSGGHLLGSILIAGAVGAGSNTPATLDLTPLN